MSAIPDSQIAQYIKSAGATDAQVPTMVAIALAESGGDPGNIGDVALENSTWGPSVGLWQIRSLNAQKGTGGERDEIANRNPQINATHAMAILRSQGLSAWTTYTSQKYRLFLARGTAATNGLGGGGTVQDAGLTLNPFGSLSKIFDTLSSVDMWKRIALAVFGMGSLYIGIVMLLKQSGVTNTVESAAVTVAGVVK